MDDEKIRKMLLLAKKKSERDWLVLSLMAEYGLKTGEIVALRPWHLEGDSLRVGSRVVRLRKPHLGRLSLAGGSYIFEGRKGKHISHRQVQNIVRACSRLAGEELTPNHLRRVFARRFVEEGGDAKELKRLLGHAHLQTTARLLIP